MATPLGRFRFSVTDAASPVANPVPRSIRSMAGRPIDQWTPSQLADAFRYWRTLQPQWSEANARIDAAWARHPQPATQLVMGAAEEGRLTHRLDRGEFLHKREAVSKGAPTALHPMPEGAPLDRRALADWLVARDSPTTARSIVNRVWQAYFGTGLVATADDFGTQGERPSHPELLDWLAVEFMGRDWRLKDLHRLIVTSRTYQQTSSVRADLLERDPQNRLLARGPRYRLDGESVRDVALTASGLLNREIGGPPVFPPARSSGPSQPAPRRVGGRSTRSAGVRSPTPCWGFSTRRRATPRASAATARTRRCRRSRHSTSRASSSAPGL
jgi:hypothetical protein